jgi:molybdopterin-guanine dinucleotide biosynthesis protein A
MRGETVGERGAAGAESAARHGYLLAGGRSERFGADKRQAELEGSALAARAASVLATAVGADGRVTAVGPPERRLAALRLPWLDDAVPEARRGQARLGPCAGLLAATRAGGGLVLACDMPLVPATTLQVLAHLADVKRPAAPVVAGRLMPLSAFWPSDAAPALEAELVHGRGRVLDAFWAAGGLAVPAAELGLRGEDAWLFTSVNTPYDLAELARQIRARGGLWT